MLNNSGESGHPSLILTLGGMLSAFTTENNVCYRLIIYGLYYAEVGEGNGTPLQYFCLENPMDGGAWWATVHGVAKSWAQLSN